MKELLSLFSQMSESLIGQRFSPMKAPSEVVRAPQKALAFLAEAHNALSPDTEIKHFVAECDGLNMSKRVVAYEAAFSAAVCLDLSHPRERPRIVELAELAPAHIAGLGLGTGHALSRLRIDAHISQALSEHYLGWMMMDAYGMHEGYFHWFDSVQRMQAPKNLPPLAMAAYDQGIGRALYFIANGDAQTMQQLIERFPMERRANSWRGIGLMVSFWGVDEEQQIKRLLKDSRQFRPYFQQGAAQGIGLRVDMDDTTDHTSESAKIIVGASVNDTAEFVADCLAKHSDETFDSRSYSNWQNEMVRAFSDSRLECL